MVASSYTLFYSVSCEEYMTIFIDDDRFRFLQSHAEAAEHVIKRLQHLEKVTVNLQMFNFYSKIS